MSFNNVKTKIKFEFKKNQCFENIFFFVYKKKFKLIINVVKIILCCRMFNHLNYIIYIFIIKIIRFSFFHEIYKFNLV